MLADLEQAEDAVASLRRRLVAAQEDERRNVARELHDEIGQELTALRFSLEAARGKSEADSWPVIESAIETTDRLIESLRDLSLSLRPAILDDLGLIPAIESLIRRLAEQGMVDVKFEHIDEIDRFDSETETALYRVVQEGLTNVARHAETGTAKLSITTMDSTVAVSVEDEGTGFEPNTVLDSPGSSGLAGMRERVELLGGKLVVESSPGNGTRLKAELPAARPTLEGSASGPVNSSGS